MGKITKLTKAQEAEIPDYIEKWVRQAAKPTNRDETTKAIKDIYKRMGEDEPLVIYGRSPDETVNLAVLYFLTLGSEKNQLRAQLDAQLDAQLSAQLRAQLSTQLRAQLNAQLNAQLHDANDNTTRRILDSIKSAFYVHDWWLVWCGWYNYAQHIGVKFDKDIYDLFTTYNKNTGLTIPYKGVVFISERPTDIKWENQVLHSDNGSTIKWADGQELYFLRGCSFTKEQWELIMSQKLTMPEIAKMGSDGKLNADQTAVAIQYLGVDNLLEGMNAELISTGKKYDHWQKSSELAKMIGQPGYTWIENEPTKLYKVENFMDTGDTEYCIVMEHPSIKGKKYLEWVEPEIGIKADADLAQAVAFGMTKEDYINADEA